MAKRPQTTARRTRKEAPRATTPTAADQSLPAGTADDIDREIEAMEAAAAARQAAACKRVRTVLDSLNTPAGRAGMAKATTAATRLRPLRELMDNLDAVWSMGNGSDDWTQQACRWVILDYIGGLLDSDGYHRADYFKSMFGIDPARLRKAASRGHIRRIKAGATTVYSVADVRARWAADTYIPPTANKPA